MTMIGGRSEGGSVNGGGYPNGDQAGSYGGNNNGGGYGGSDQGGGDKVGGQGGGASDMDDEIPF
jgi:single-strand DNA-binding protein